MFFDGQPEDGVRRGTMLWSTPPCNVHWKENRHRTWAACGSKPWPAGSAFALAESCRNGSVASAEAQGCFVPVLGARGAWPRPVKRMKLDPDISTGSTSGTGGAQRYQSTLEARCNAQLSSAEDVGGSADSPSASGSGLPNPGINSAAELRAGGDSESDDDVQICVVPDCYVDLLSCDHMISGRRDTLEIPIWAGDYGHITEWDGYCVTFGGGIRRLASEVDGARAGAVDEVPSGVSTSPAGEDASDDDGRGEDSDEAERESDYEDDEDLGTEDEVPPDPEAAEAAAAGAPVPAEDMGITRSPGL